MADSIFSTDLTMNLTYDDSLTGNQTAEESIDDYEYPIWYDMIPIAVPSVLAIIFVVGIVGNAILIFIVLRNKPMHTKPNVLIVNLAIGDFLLILFSVPCAFVFYAFEQWYFGNAICKLNEFMQTLSLGVSVFTLTALSVDRFIAIVFPLASYSSRSLTRIIVASLGIWVLSAGLAIMDLVGAHVISCEDCDVPYHFCNLYPDEWGEGYRKFRALFRFIVYFAVPLIIIFCLYVIIAVVLLRQSLSPSSKMEADASSSTLQVRGASKLRHVRQESVAKQNESRKKVAKVVLSFVVIFIVCFLPIHVFVMCYNFQTEFKVSMGWIILQIVGLWLMFFNSAINPLALYVLCAEYRRYVHHYLFGCCCSTCRLKNIGNHVNRK